MTPFEVLYGIKCDILIQWDNLVDWIMIGCDMLKELNQMENKVKQNLKTSHDRHKSYVDMKCVHKEFNVGCHVYLKVRPN